MDFGPHFVQIAFILFVAYVGYALGKSDLRIDPVLTAVTVVVAVILHGTWQLALPHPHRGIDWVARAVARAQSPALVAVALVETVGIWLPVLVIQWVALRTRIWTAAYIIGAATIGAFAHYAPSLFHGRSAHPEYEVWLKWALVFATVPFAIGCLAKRRQQTRRAPEASHAATDGH
jgi:hypothetical protein